MARFRKMHGLGNDFVVFDGRNGGFMLDETAARAIADRRFGIGCDQVIVIERSAAGADAAMRIFNADGDEVESCGNAARCVARLLIEEMDETVVRLDTKGGPLVCRDAGGDAITVDIGRPRFDWREIPLARETNTQSFPLVIEGRTLSAAAVSVGNPHCVVFVDDAEGEAVGQLGPLIEHDPLFPARINAEFAQVLDPERVRIRVWERGVGITRACGTGACATAVSAHRRGLCGRNVDIVLDGGSLRIVWRESDDHILMTGGASFVFAGDVDLARLDIRS